jgi:hypothetical protein
LREAVKIKKKNFFLACPILEKLLLANAHRTALDRWRSYSFKIAHSPLTLTGLSFRILRIKPFRLVF